VLKQLLQKHRHFILYGIIGGISAGLDFIVFTLLTRYTEINYLICNVMGVACGMTLSFTLNSFINFKKTNKMIKRIISFYAVGLSGLGLSTLLLYLFIDVFDIQALLSKGATILAVVLFQYILNSRVTFAK